jgi:hypothetical protein
VIGYAGPLLVAMLTGSLRLYLVYMTLALIVLLTVARWGG